MDDVKRALKTYHDACDAFYEIWREPKSNEGDAIAIAKNMQEGKL